MKKRNIRIIIISILLTCISGVVLPLFMDKYIFANNYPSSLSNSDWSGFLGGIWGGIIGGVGTLIAVCITTLDTREVQEESKKQAAIAISKDKLETIISALSSYWEKSSDIAKIYIQLIEYMTVITSTEEKINAISNDLLRPLKNEVKESLLSKCNELTLVKSKSETEFADLKNQIIKLIGSISYEEMLLKLLIADIEFSNKIIDLIDTTHSILTNICQNDVSLSTELNLQIEKFQESSKQFVKEYENKFINLN